MATKPKYHCMICEMFIEAMQNFNLFAMRIDNSAEVLESLENPV